jgi:hypothetical protein
MRSRGRAAGGWRIQEPRRNFQPCGPRPRAVRHYSAGASAGIAGHFEGSRSSGSRGWHWPACWVGAGRGCRHAGRDCRRAGREFLPRGTGSAVAGPGVRWWRTARKRRDAGSWPVRCRAEAWPGRPVLAAGKRRTRLDRPAPRHGRKRSPSGRRQETCRTGDTCGVPDTWI